MKPFNHFIYPILLLAMLLGSAQTAMADKPYTDPYLEYDEIDHWDLDLDDNIEIPEISDGERKDIRTYMKNLFNDLAKRNYIAELDRNDEVVVVSLPCDDLFLPNDTLLWQPRAARLLDPLKPLLADPDMFKIVFAVNSDNTGSAVYNMNLSDARKDSMYEWFDLNAAPDLIVVPYSMGDTDPIEPNNTRAGRAANRRVDVYFIPGPKMIELSHKKQLLKRD
ncbi:MAG: OmpA family protein [Muribaculaceae bacterium]|nr:OmpA family protein [Muribaculaceae bacterium]